MSYADLHFDAKTSIARTSIAAWNALMRADPVFGRYALSDIGRSAFLNAFTVVDDGTWRVGGQLHRIGGPAHTYANGSEEWYERDQLHRIGGPAIAYADGDEEWRENGKRHRVGGPAVVYAGGCEEWYEHGELHRIGGPAVIYVNGVTEWWTRGRRQAPGKYEQKNVDTPAVTRNSTAVLFCLATRRIFRAHTSLRRHWNT